jgi:hypothetical protein
MGSFLLVLAVGSTAQAQYPNNQYPNQYPNNQDDRNDRNRNRRGRNWDNYGNYGGSFDLRQTALNAGYNEGLADGTSDRQRNRRFDFQNQSDYRRATKDYSSRLGNRDLYSRYFREAYETGYNDGFYPDRAYVNNNNNNNNNNNGSWNQNNNGTWDRNNNGTWDRNNRRGRNWDRYGTYGGSSNFRQTALNAGYNEGIKQGRNDRNRNNQSDFRNNSAYRDASKDYSSRLGGDRELYRRYYREGYENGYYDGLNSY